MYFQWDEWSTMPPHNDLEENCKMNVVVVNRRPHLCLFTTRDIPAGEELRYDYNVPNLPWRKVSTNKQVNVAYFMPFIQKKATPVKTRRDDFTNVPRNCTFYINRLKSENIGYLQNNYMEGSGCTTI